ncbi:MAG: ribonuclease HII [Candidatus Dojkabacteria bacterium]|nr:ribonuclease HII [Candidatus Dojkabacteria bacterium]
MLNKKRTYLNLSNEESLLFNYDIIVGIDEVGRGCIAGPLYVCGFIIDKTSFKYLNHIVIKDKNFVVQDSKQLTRNQREYAYNILKNCQHFLVCKSNTEIDKNGIVSCLKDNVLSIINMVLSHYDRKRILFLVDGILKINFEKDNTKLVFCIKGDSKYFCIASASIIAKVCRDEFMISLHKNIPNYDWDKNMGYGTRKHFESIEKFGLSIYHRVSFVKNYIHKFCFLFVLCCIVCV